MSGHEHHDDHRTGGLDGRPDAEVWDERYGDEGQMWSGHANPTVLDELRDEPPGSAVDVCCGEGADALWLAERGWDVTAIDVSTVALARGRAEAARRGLSIDWRCLDLVTEPLDAGPFDLVTAHYPALRRLPDGRALRSVLQAVAPGGLLLFVHHDMASQPPEHRRFDPDDFVQPSDVTRALDAGWTIEVDEVRDRPAPESHDGHHHGPDVPDLVLRARRD